MVCGVRTVLTPPPFFLTAEPVLQSCLPTSLWHKLTALYCFDETRISCEIHVGRQRSYRCSYKMILYQFCHKFKGYIIYVYILILSLTLYYTFNFLSVYFQTNLLNDRWLTWQPGVQTCFIDRQPAMAAPASDTSHMVPSNTDQYGCKSKETITTVVPHHQPLYIKLITCNSEAS